jgi:hypothetical protein
VPTGLRALPPPKPPPLRRRRAPRSARTGGVRGVGVGVKGTRMTAAIAPGGAGGALFHGVVARSVRGVGGVLMVGVGAYGVRGAGGGHMFCGGADADRLRGVGSVRGAIIVRETSPPFRVHDASESALEEPSPCVFGGHTVQSALDTSMHGDGVLSTCKGECYTCQLCDLSIAGYI